MLCRGALLMLVVLCRLYTLEKQVRNPEALDEHEVESAPLLRSSLDTDSVFKRALDAELQKVCSFFRQKEAELYGEMGEFVHDAETYIEDTMGINMEPLEDSIVKSRSFSAGGGRHRNSSILPGLGFSRHRSSMESVDDDEDEDVDISDLPSRDIRRFSTSSRDDKHGNPTDAHDASESSDVRWHRHSGDFERDPHVSALYNAGVSLKKRAISIYVSLCELKSFIQLNRTGFSKILKKYDKTLDRSTRRSYMNTTVSTAYPFTNPTIQQLDDRIAKVEGLYAAFVTNNDLELARRELRLHLREHVVWERNTVWREMIGIERKAQAANMGIRSTLLGGEQEPEALQRQGDEVVPVTKEIVTPVGRCPVPGWLLSSTFATLLAIVVVFAIMLSVPIMAEREQQNCLAILVFASLLWSTEVRGPFLFETMQLTRIIGYSSFRHITLRTIPCRYPSSYAN